MDGEITLMYFPRLICEFSRLKIYCCVAINGWEITLMYFPVQACLHCLAINGCEITLMYFPRLVCVFKLLESGWS